MLLQTVAVGLTDLHLPLTQQLSDRREREGYEPGKSPQGGRCEFFTSVASALSCFEGLNSGLQPCGD